jgi:PAS domain S-box-containing protein
MTARGPDREVSVGEFARQVEDVRRRTMLLQRRANALQRRTVQWPLEREELLGDAITDLESSLEELQVAEEELRLQGEEIVSTREAVERERARYRELFDLAPDAYFVTDAHGTVREANRAAAALLQVSESGRLVGKPLAVFAPRESQRTLSRELHALAAEHGRREWTMRVRPRRDERLVTVGVSAVGVCGPDGRLATVRWLVRDLTEQARARAEVERLAGELERRVVERTAQLEAARAEAEAARAEAERKQREAEAANRAKADFLAVVSHELRTPLNAIAGYADLLLFGVRGTLTEAGRDAVERIRQSEHALLRLIEDLLGFAKLEAGQVRFDVGNVELGALLASVHAMLEPQMRAKGVCAEYVAPAPSLFVRADTERLQQAVLNLLTNAMKFTDNGGTVRLSTALAGELAIVCVRDTGRGIPPDQLGRIFEPFVQVDSALTRSAGGVGLGLAISRDIARAMGGDLAVESVVGVGSTFMLSVPLFAAPEQTAA